MRGAKLLLVISFLITSPITFATNGFHLEGNGPVSKAMGGAGAADDIDNYALMYNPATLGLMSGNSRFTLGLDMVNAEIDITSSTQGSVSGDRKGKNRNPYFGPAVSYVTRKGNMVFGLGFFVEGGLGTEYGDDSFLSATPGGYATGEEIGSRLLVTRVPVGLSVDLTEQLTVGATLDVVWQGWNTNALLGVDQVAALLAQGRVSGSAVGPVAGLLGASGAAYVSSSKDEIIASGYDSFGWGAKLGLTYDLSENTRLGLVYSLETELEDAEGDVTVTAYGPGATPGPPTAFKGDIRLADFQMPAWFALGLNHRVSDKLTLNADVRHIQYENVMRNLDLRMDLEGVGTLNVLVPQNWDDLTIFSVGGAYKYSDKLTLRLGGSFADNPVDSDSLIPTLVTIPKTHLMAGFSYETSPRSQLDFVFSWAIRESQTNSSQPFYGAGASNPSLRAEVEEYNLQIGYSWRF